MSRVLIVDDEASICWAFRESLTAGGHEVDTAASAEEALELVAGRRPDAVVLDVRLPRMDGLAAMQLLRDRIGAVPIVVVTAFGNLDTAVRAMENGAFDYLAKPFDLAQATAVVNRALAAGNGHAQSQTPDALPDADDALIGSSPAMQEVFKKIALVAASDVPVLVTGESGTGKELVVRAIHRHSRRRNGPFLPVCLGALSSTLVESELFGHVRGAFTGATQERQGLLELGKGGTVFLDEIADTIPAIQVKLLRAVEFQEVTAVGDARPRGTNIRVIAATSRPLDELMAAGHFREDLYFRLSVFHVHLPPLRDRRDDIPLLADHFAKQIGGPTTPNQLSEEVRDALLHRDWPGNVRQLRNAVQHAAIVARGSTIRPEHLPSQATIPDSSPQSIDHELAEVIRKWAEGELAEGNADGDEVDLYARFLALAEPAVLKTALAHCGQNRAAAAKLLGLHRATVRQKLRQHEIE